MIGQALPVNLSLNTGTPVNTVMPRAVQVPDSTSQIIGEANQITAEMNQFATGLQQENLKAEQQRLQSLQAQYLGTLQASRSASPAPLTSPTGNTEVTMAVQSANQLYTQGNQFVGNMQTSPQATMPTMPTSTTTPTNPSTAGTPVALNSTTLSGDKGTQ
jgi:hypothetical protein